MSSFRNTRNARISRAAKAFPPGSAAPLQIIHMASNPLLVTGGSLIEPAPTGYGAEVCLWAELHGTMSHTAD